MPKKPSYNNLLQRIHDLEKELVNHQETKLALQESEAKCRAMMDAFDGLIYVCSRDYRIEFLNERLVERTGDNAIGDLCYKVLHDRDSVCPWCVNERVFQGETVRWEVQSPKDNRWYYIINTPIRHPDGEVSKQAMICDITERKRVEQLLEGEREILEMVATGRALNETLDFLNLTIEKLSPGSLCSILLLDEEGKRLYNRSAPSLPEEYLQRINGLYIGPSTGSCGTAAYRGEKVIVENIAEDPLWAKGRNLANRFDLRACWSVPIRSNTGKMLGTFALYDRKPRRPSQGDVQLVESAAYLAGIAIDRDLSERALKESELKYRGLFEDSGDAILMTTREGRFLDVNQSGMDLFGYAKEEMLNEISVPQIYVDPGDRDKFRDEIDQKGSVRNFEARLRKKDGTEMDCLITSGVHRSNDGAVLGYQSIVRDVTERKQMEEALRKSAEKIKMFAYSVSHDLKSPAVGIHGLTKLLHRRYNHVLDEKGKSYCNQILKTSEQIAALVEEINVYISTKQAPLNIEMVNPKEILQTLKNEFSTRLSSRGISWIEPDFMQEIKGDRLSILRILRNLVDNALKHGGSSLNTIGFGYDESDRFHILSVSDNGVGIEKESSEKIFDPFQRQGRSEKVEGMGLGLAIVKEIADQHGGNVWIDSPAGGGTKFCVSISKKL